MTITVTVFKDELRWSKDLHQKARELKNKGIKNYWDAAKEETNKVDFTQRIRTSPEFETTVSGKKKTLEMIQKDAVLLAKDIAGGKHFRVKVA